MTTRRGFMQLLAGAMLAPVSAKAAYAAPSVPLIVGDGVHDDTAGLNALLRGDVVEFANVALGENAGWVDPDYFVFPKGDFKTTSEIIIGGPKDNPWSHKFISMKDAKFFTYGGRPAILFEHANDCTVDHIWVKSERPVMKTIEFVY